MVTGESWLSLKADTAMVSHRFFFSLFRGVVSRTSNKQQQLGNCVQGTGPETIAALAGETGKSFKVSPKGVSHVVYEDRQREERTVLNRF
jgi:hypothetical protein